MHIIRLNLGVATALHASWIRCRINAFTSYYSSLLGRVYPPGIILKHVGETTLIT